MAGPSSEGSSRRKSSPYHPRPPRPPNAWILYRSDKLKEFPPPAPGQPRMAQAEISKAISIMWKNETPEVRAYYERLSEIKKAEHLAKYPDYRFQPMKRADKERARAEKLAEKERERTARKAKTRARKQPPPPLFTTEARLGQAGPSTPGSSASSSSSSPTNPTPIAAALPVGASVTAATAATTPAPGTTPLTDNGSISTPRSTPPSPSAAPPVAASTLTTFPSLAPVPGPSSFFAMTNPSSPYPPPPAPPTLFPPLFAPQPGVPQRPPTASDWPHGHQFQTYGVQAQAPTSDQILDFTSLDAVSSLLDIPQFLPGSSTAMDYLEIPSTNYQQPLGWTPNDPSPLTDIPSYDDNTLRAVLEVTNNPGMYNMLDFNINEFTGTEPIDVEYITGTSLFDKTEYNPVLAALFNNWQSTPAVDDAPTSSAIVDNEEMEFCDFEDLVQALQPCNEVASQVNDNTTMTTTGVIVAAPPLDGANRPEASQRYVPPAGAMNTSTRRVGASWRPIQLTPESD